MADPYTSASTDSSFLTRNSERGTNATMQKILDEMARADKTAAAPVTPPAVPGDPGQPTVPDGPPGGWLRSLKPGETPLQTKILKDIGYGVLAEGPGQVVGGWFDFWRHAGSAVGQMGEA